MTALNKKTTCGSIFPAIMLVVIFILSLATIELIPADQGLVAAVFAPGTSNAQMVRVAEDASAQIIDRRGSFLFVRSDQEGLPARLRAAGAYLVIDPVGAVGCGPLVLPGDKTFGR